MYNHLTKLTAALGLMLLTACGSSYGDRCAASVQCSGGNDKDVDACVATLNGTEQVAAAYDCSDAYFKFTDCVDKTGTCDNKHYRTTCDGEAAALATCENAASGQ